MSDKDFEEPIDEVPGEEGSEAQASGPDSQGDQTDAAADAADDELTVEDILDAPQTDEAAVAEASDDDRDLLLDLKRVQAEYANYRRRTEEQRQVEIDRAKGSVAKGLLPVLDDLDRAREHGDLESGPLKGVADKLIATLDAEGLTKFGAPGDPFDPELHEAVQNDGSGTEPVIGAVYRGGYRLGDKVIRTAMVTVTDPAPAGQSQPQDTQSGAQ